jgi:hypothetical protein
MLEQVVSVHLFLQLLLLRLLDLRHDGAFRLRFFFETPLLRLQLDRNAFGYKKPGLLEILWLDPREDEGVQVSLTGEEAAKRDYVEH